MVNRNQIEYLCKTPNGRRMLLKAYVKQYKEIQEREMKKQARKGRFRTWWNKIIRK
jgi:hypothetical protein